MNTAADPAQMIHLNHDQIARVAHESYRSTCPLIYDTPPPAWSDTHDTHRAYMTGLVASVAESPEHTARDAHQGWLKKQTDAGWTPAERYSKTEKTSPHVQPWENLTPKYRLKAALMHTIIRYLLHPEAECA